jgi:hypothetical protein
MEPETGIRDAHVDLQQRPRPDEEQRHARLIGQITTQEPGDRTAPLVRALARWIGKSSLEAAARAKGLVRGGACQLPLRR